MCYVSCSPLCKLRNVFNNGRSHLACSHFLWSPYVIGQTITFSSCFFLSSFFFFFSLPNLSDRRLNVYHRPTLAHGVAQCEFRMQVWNALHAAHWKHRTQKVAKNRQLDTIAQLCRAISSQLRHVSTIGKKLVMQQYVIHMSAQYGELRPILRSIR